MPLSEDPIHGRCLCGAVVYEIQPPVRFCAHCHCTMCRRAAGAPLVTWAGIPRDRFRVLQGRELLTRYPSSPGAARSFCSRCGSQLLFESERWPGEYHVTVNNLDRLPVPPAAHVYYSDRVTWLDVGDDLPRLGGPTGVEPLPKDPH
jgi:hypothetical protein